jgi:hypothetical protein
MIQEIDLQSNNTLGFRVAGKVDKETIQSAIDRVKLELKSSSKLSIYLEVAELEGMTAGAFKERIAFSFSHLMEISKKVKKVALVTNIDWLKKLANGLYHLNPMIKEKSFPMEEAEKAKQWLSENP